MCRRRSRHLHQASSSQTALRLRNRRHGPSLPLPRQRAGWELSYNRRSPGACCQTAWRRLVLGRWPKSTLDIVVEPALGDAVPTIGCDLARSRRPSAGPSGPVVKPLLRSPTKTGRKSHVKAVLSSGLADTRAAPSGRERRWIVWACMASETCPRKREASQPGVRRPSTRVGAGSIQAARSIGPELRRSRGGEDDVAEVK